jgi:hypothetical protein
MSGKVTIEDVTGTIYVFENRHVVHNKRISAANALVSSGEFQTGRLKVSYMIKNLNGTRSIVLGQTSNSYRMIILSGEISALRQAILYVAEKEKIKVFQSNKKPDYGFELLKIEQAGIISVKNLKRPKKLNAA